jgi:putative FmdB family regulatory protein
MPLYDYQCPACGQLEDVWARMDEVELPCPGCGAAMRRQITRRWHAHPDLDYYDETLESYITSRRQRERLLRERGLSEAYGKGWI